MNVSKSPALQLSHLTKMYDDKHGIRDIDLVVQEGEVFGFLGPNGAGKSTTINTILDLLKPDEGTVSVLGMDHHKQVKQVHQRIGFVSGDMETDPTLTGKQYLSYVAHLRGGIHKDKVHTLAKRFRADLTTRIKHLSRGNRQKISLIAALLHDPQLLILDEPTSGLDPLMQAEFNKIVREQRAKGKTTFISSHVLSEVQTICDRVGFIRDGKLIRVSPLESLLDHTTHRIAIHFKKLIPDTDLVKIKGIKDIRREDGTISFTFSGDLNKLLNFLVSHPLNNITITEPDLEELFMNYYRSTEATDV